MHEIKINDLRSFAKAGNSTVKLDSYYHYEIAKIKKDGIYVSGGTIFIDGRRTELKTQVPFYEIYKHIDTIKQGRVLLAERRAGKLIGTWKYEQMIGEMD
ncbi:hypothetical protein [Lactovum miscens]|uniref:Uncharacterized protein n=1 Tax=Lactovum miscens TaxID=190387 RepID=A0A841C479_9LACT|nr:hypothetical protein [Lactovum miscens]MBB5887623.1 hypothetical protein [Lactovum miscens]